MSADLLRRAAAKIRDTAQAATPGPWEQEGSSIAAGEFIILDALPDGGTGTWTKQTADAAHVAMWSPLVAELVAQWLDDAARRDERKPRPMGPHDVQAHRLALFILGEDA
ncbi:hypothetical protein JN535_08660 [Cellulosimicrobium cellulans]|uniref:hypothetical protein n=1 Tax=Cellulosimicrobium cellulans TaxID=1710 RepID=UPI001962EC4A|nr:hypothetical protein [Cellulosimicrobium cellulans]MBN0040233.1 hypothetical protein [Cellulosimicrobium cellulans]